MAECGFTYWQVLPFCMVDEYNSPYKSYSSFSGNLFFIDLELLCKEQYLTKEDWKNGIYVCFTTFLSGTSDAKLNTLTAGVE